MPTPTSNPAQSIERELSLALAHHRAGRPERAEPHYRRILVLEPDHAEANNLLGLVVLARGDGGRAVELIGKAVAAKDDSPYYHCNLGVALNGVEEFEKAVLHFNRALELKPDYAEAYSNMGMSLRSTTRPAEAAECYRAAVELRPQEPGFHVNLGNALFAIGDLEAAADCYRKALDLRPDYPAASLALERTEAEIAELLSPSGGIPPGAAGPAVDGEYFKARGRALRHARKLEAAERQFRLAMQLDPDDAEASQLLSLIRRRESHGPDMDRLVEIAETTDGPAAQRTFAGFALGQWFADLGDADRSFHFYELANRTHRAGVDYDVEHDVADLDIIRALFDPVPAPLPERSPGGFAPIFVVGLPRAGKTTVEGMLARHHRTQAAGELRMLPILARELSIRHGLAKPGAHISQVPAEDFVALGRRYREFVERIVPPPGAPIDTMPPNFRMIGVIRMCLPNARIVHCRREPLSHCIAMFEKRFPGGYDFTYDLAELARHYGAYLHMMEHWAAAFPGFVLDVDAAALAGNAAETRRLLEFCGLEWDEACVAPFVSEPRLGEQISGDNPGLMAAGYERTLAPLLDRRGRGTARN